MEGALTALLLGNAGVTALAGQRVYWRLVPQGVATGSWVVMHRVSGQRDYTTQAPSGLVSSRVQVDCVGASYGAAKVLARAVVAAAGGYRGTVGGMAIQGIFIDAERDDDDSNTGDVATRFRTSLDLQIWHPET